MAINLKYLILKAFQSCENPDWDAYYRRICRWYSKTFHTPLHVVINDLLVNDVLLAYFEEILQELQNAENPSKYLELYRKFVLDDNTDNNETQNNTDDDAWVVDMLNKLSEQEHSTKIEEQINYTDNTKV